MPDSMKESQAKLISLLKVKVAQSCLTLCDHDPMDDTVHSILQAEYWSGQPFPSPGHLLNPGIEPRSPALQVDSLPAEPQGKPKSTGVGSLTLLQGIFPIQESTWGLLHCRQILYQLSYTPVFFSVILYTYIFIEVKFTKLFIHIFYYIFLMYYIYFCI